MRTQHAGGVKKMRVTRKVNATNVANARFVDQSRGGTGSAMMREHSEIIEFEVKPGWRAGTKLTFAGKGDEIPGSPGRANDLVVVIEQKPHVNFTRENDHLIARVRSIPLQQALCGVRLTLPGIDGAPVSASFGGNAEGLEADASGSRKKVTGGRGAPRDAPVRSRAGQAGPEDRDARGRDLRRRERRVPANRHGGAEGGVQKRLQGVTCGTAQRRASERARVINTKTFLERKKKKSNQKSINDTDADAGAFAFASPEPVSSTAVEVSAESRLASDANGSSAGPAPAPPPSRRARRNPTPPSRRLRRAASATDATASATTERTSASADSSVSESSDDASATAASPRRAASRAAASSASLAAASFREALARGQPLPRFVFRRLRGQPLVFQQPP